MNTACLGQIAPPSVVLGNVAVLRSAQLSAGVWSGTEINTGVDGIVRAGGTAFNCPAGYRAIVREIHLATRAPLTTAGGLLIDLWTSGGLGIRIHGENWATDVVSKRLAWNTVMNPLDALAVNYGFTGELDYLISGALLPINPV